MAKMHMDPVEEGRLFRTCRGKTERHVTKGNVRQRTVLLGGGLGVGSLGLRIRDLLES